MKKLFVPEVVQTSNMDCGPASLKCLLEGFGIPVGYGRLREACQTGIDGTSVDTMEAVASQLGLEAEQIIIPEDHLFLKGSTTLPALVVVILPDGLTHFVVVWRRHGNLLQAMDPAVGRRWVSRRQFASEIYRHTTAVPAADWREFAGSPEFQGALEERFAQLGISVRQAKTALEKALADASWRSLAGLDASLRLVAALERARGIRRGREAAQLIDRLQANPELISERYWSVREAPAGESSDGEDASGELMMRGAVLVRVRGKRNEAVNELLSAELSAAIKEPPLNPGRQLLSLLRQSETSILILLMFGLAAAAGGVIVEALLFRGLFDVAGELGLAGQRMGGIAAILIFSLGLFLLDLPLFSSAARLGRQLENRLRIAFLSKIPKLGDRYFQSRLTSDMAERSHATHRLRHLPDLMRQTIRAFFELLATAAGVIWLDRSAAPFIGVAVGAALISAFATQPLLAERDLRVRSHAAGLTRFYLESMLGLLAIRAHRAERSVRREHEKLLGEWGQAALRLQRAVVTAETVQLVSMFGLVALLLLTHPLVGANIGRVLLVVYWALNLPTIGEEIGALARQIPYYRNLTLRLLEPLGSPEEEVPSGAPEEEAISSRNVPLASAPSIAFRNVKVEVAGHTILEDLSVEIEAGSHVAIVGRSGAGKSSFAGVLLGWLKPSEGEVLVNDAALDYQQLRNSTAWVDPAVQLWNRPLSANLTYGSRAGVLEAGKAIDLALLRNVLESLPDGLQTKLGEGGGLVSGGEGQRVRFGRALLRRQTRLAILDEPFRGLDREKRRELLERARHYWRDSTMLCITHDLSETLAFDRVLVFEGGHLIEDGVPKELACIADSRYAQLLEAEHETRSGRWSSATWRRIRIQAGRVVESLPRSTEEKRPESEVA